MNSKKRFILIFAVLLVFIWGHSMMTGNDSAVESGRMLRLIQRVFDHFHIPLKLSDHIVRKAAHFIEHAAAGFILGLLFFPGALSEKNDRLLRKVLMILPLLSGFFIGFIDETIQVFSGRGAAIQDVWLDFSGICLGSLAAFLIAYLRYIRNTVRNAQSENPG